MEISQESAQEYREVAGLVCLDLDMLLEMAKDSSCTKEDLIWHIKNTHEKKDNAIKNKKDRQWRYQAAQVIFNTPGTFMQIGD